MRSSARALPFVAQEDREPLRSEALEAPPANTSSNALVAQMHACFPEGEVAEGTAYIVHDLRGGAAMTRSEVRFAAGPDGLAAVALALRAGWLHGLSRWATRPTGEFLAGIDAAGRRMERPPALFLKN